MLYIISLRLVCDHITLADDSATLFCLLENSVMNIHEIPGRYDQERSIAFGDEGFYCFWTSLTPTRLSTKGITTAPADPTMQKGPWTHGVGGGRNRAMP